MKKGRNTRLFGERNGKAKLTRRQVAAIRRMAKRGHYFQSTLARLYGVSNATVSYIVNGGRWKEVKE